MATKATTARTQADKANIDRVAKEGMRFTDSYGEQTWRAARATE